MSADITTIRSLLEQVATIPPEKRTMFFKTDAGSYGEHDQFLGVKVPAIRTIAKQFYSLSSDALVALLASPFNEERFLALCIMVKQYERADAADKERMFQLYLANKARVNNWNLVDASAHLIVGAHLHGKDRALLATLAQSPVLWDRRIAIVATWYFIRKGDLATTFALAQLLLTDQHDLMHKATGWMLREAGQKDEAALVAFLQEHAQRMPRTMLRYALEKFSPEQRQQYMAR